MKKIRRGTHTTLTETALLVTRTISQYAGVKLIAPGVIVAKRSGKRFVTVVYTTAGFELIISGVGVQKVAVHLADPQHGTLLIDNLKKQKSLSAFTWQERERKPKQ